MNHAVDVDHDLLVAKLSKELAKLRATNLQKNSLNQNDKLMIKKSGYFDRSFCLS